MIPNTLRACGKNVLNHWNETAQILVHFNVAFPLLDDTWRPKFKLKSRSEAADFVPWMLMLAYKGLLVVKLSVSIIANGKCMVMVPVVTKEAILEMSGRVC